MADEAVGRSKQTSTSGSPRVERRRRTEEAEEGGHTRTRAKADTWVAKFGGRLASTPAEAARGAAFVFTCVGNDDDLREVTLGQDGAFQALGNDAIFVEDFHML
jgi:3-hydroxyisobutyrate dehydrogenase